MRKNSVIFPNVQVRCPQIVNSTLFFLPSGKGLPEKRGGERERDRAGRLRRELASSAPHIYNIVWSLVAVLWSSGLVRRRAGAWRKRRLSFAGASPGPPPRWGESCTGCGNSCVGCRFGYAGCGSICAGCKNRCLGSTVFLVLAGLRTGPCRRDADGAGSSGRSSRWSGWPEAGCREGFRASPPGPACGKGGRGRFRRARGPCRSSWLRAYSASALRFLLRMTNIPAFG